MEKNSMYSSIKRALGLIIFSLLASQVQALEMKGAASYQELGLEYYIASLYLKDKEYDSQSLLSYNGWQRIKVKVTAKRWSARKWKAQWQNNIAINNAVSNQVGLNRDLAHFTEFPKASFIAGDEIIVEYLPQQGSLVTFYGHEVLKTSDKQFYNYILRTWLGKFSPNRIFREKISGLQAPQEILVATLSKPVSIERIKSVEKWFSTAQEKRLAKLNKAREAEKQRQQELKAANIQRKKIAEQKKLAAEQKKRILAAEQKARLAREKRDQVTQNKLKAKAQAKIKAEQEKKRLAMVAEEQKRLKIVNQQKYFYQLYQWELRTRVNETVAYPPWAKQFNQQGTVEVTFKVNRSGILSELEFIGEDVSPILRQEVEKRLLSAVEAIAPPKNLKGEKWSFDLRYVFSLKLAEQETLLKPLRPI